MTFSKNQLYIISIVVLLITILVSCLDKNSNKTENVLSEILLQDLPDKVDFNFHVKPILSDKCFKCHGPDEAAREDRIGLHIKDMAFSPIDSSNSKYAIVANHPDQSELIARINTENVDDLMPPPESNLALSDYDKKVLEKWISEGAVWKDHWAFTPPERPSIPQNTSEKVQNEIDNFIFNKLKENGMSFSDKVIKEKLIRRVSFDLTGLPPDKQEVIAFVEDQDPHAFEKVVDKLLESLAYAERMTTEWMDLARYADTHGYQDDFERTMWPWRDWVIHAFRNNMAYDDFVKWQLAGDMIPNASLEQIIASGFNRNHKITAEGGVIEEEYRTEYVADRTHTFGIAFLGLGIECARCHDHKYDPISQKNYYQLFSFFNNISERGMFDRDGMVPEPYITLTQEELETKAKYINNIDTLDEIKLMVMEELSEPRTTTILQRGQYDQPGEKVTASTPTAILPFKSGLRKDRLGLSEWLFQDDHPLTARVAVNRLWQQIFGKGIVATSYDFGNQGSLPTHPELLDFLAVKFKNENWDIKKMLKYMVMSYTYQQSDNVTQYMLNKDPENNFLGRATRVRLSSEMIRDQALKVSGLLNPEIGGPSVKPYQPEGLWAETTGGGGGKTAKYVPDKGKKIYRRSLYTYWKRTVPPPGMMTFDASSRDFCTVKRQETNTPLQALILMNDPQILEASRVLANKSFDEKQDVENCIADIFFSIVSRPIKDKEKEILIDLYEKEKTYFDKNPDKTLDYLSIGQTKIKTSDRLSEIAGLAQVTSAIFNLDESISKG